FCREALVWRSLRHDFILPLLGIFVERKMHFLVSPLLPNGTLMEWRRNIKPLSLAEVHRLILEVAEGIQYLHSEGIVHGNIKGEKVLLDSNLHCRIVGFGLTRHSDATVTGTLAYTPHYAAPELFSNCRECNEPWCDGCRGEPDVQKKTMATDVYAFGCLYYAVSLSIDPSAHVTRLVQIFFNSVPYEGESPLRVGWLVTTGERPQRLENPEMEESLWKFINDCWNSQATERPPINQIVQTVKSFVTPTQWSYFRSTMPRVAETSLPSLPKNHPLSISVSPAVPVILPPSPATSEPPLPETFRSVLRTLREVLYTLLRHQ
ncbi:kinase-like domain-containing protein, partial [Amanita rubescens]